MQIIIMQFQSFDNTTKYVLDLDSFQFIAETLPITFKGLRNNWNKDQDILKRSLLYLPFRNYAIFASDTLKQRAHFYLCVQLICVLHLELGWLRRKLIYLLYFLQQKKQFPKRPPPSPSFLSRKQRNKQFRIFSPKKIPHCILWSDRPPSSQTPR